MTSRKMPNLGEAPTGKELNVLWHMSYGLSNAAIGRALFVSEDTVKTHATRLYAKLGVRDRAHATRVGIERGYLKPDKVRQEFAPSGEGVERHFAACYTGSGCQCHTVVAS
jgi:DNA-binding CsgD family transcriptional regulator